MLDAPKGTESDLLRAANRVALTLGLGFSVLVFVLTGPGVVPALVAAVPFVGVVFIVGRGSANTERLDDERAFPDDESAEEVRH